MMLTVSKIVHVSNLCIISRQNQDLPKDLSMHRKQVGLEELTQLVEEDQESSGLK